MPEYVEHYALQEAINQDPKIIPAPELYHFDDSQIYASQMDRLAQPLPSGEESPFSSVTPGSGHAMLLAVLSHMQGILGHELNLTPDRTWVQVFRMLGIEIGPPEYPVINIIFYRSPEAIRSQIPVSIPFGTQVISSLDNGLAAFTIYDVEITGDAETIEVPARLNRIGAIPNIRPREFSIIPKLLSFISKAENDGKIISEGRNNETLSEAMLRAREQLKTGQRCVTARDYYFWAKDLLRQLGVTNSKVNVVPRVAYGAPGVYNDLVTIVVYPAAAAAAIAQKLTNDFSMGDERIAVIGAEIIAIEGVIEVRALPNLEAGTVRDLCAVAIASKVNPPFGVWGDQQFPISIAKALEQIEGVYAAPKIELVEVNSGVPLAQLDIRPWHLLEIQQSIRIAKV